MPLILAMAAFWLVILLIHFPVVMAVLAGIVIVLVIASAVHP